MLCARMTAPTWLFKASSILGMVLTIAPMAQAVPRSTGQMAMQSAPICFIERSGRTLTNLDRLCGLRNIGTKVDPNGPLDLNIDVNRDGISDQFLEAAQQNLDAQEQSEKEYQAKVRRNLPDQEASRLSKEYDARSQKIGRELTDRLPYSNRVRQLFAEAERISEQINKLPESDKKNREALGRKSNQIYQKYSQDPSYITVEQAQRKVYKEIERRGSAKWLYSPSGSS
jgi:hypothetical protein